MLLLSALASEQILISVNLNSLGFSECQMSQVDISVTSYSSQENTVITKEHN